MDSRGLSDLVLPGTEDRAPIAALPGPDGTIVGYDAITGKELWTFAPEDGSFPLVEQAAPALGLFGISGLTDSGGGPEKLFIVDPVDGAKSVRRVTGIG